jgi:hypothetical protein
MRSAIALAAVLVSACMTTRPHEREKLAAPVMESPFADDRAGGEHGDKVAQSKTGGGLPGGAPGGGCGCTQ